MTEQPFPSTLWAWKKVRMASPPEARQNRASKRRRWHFLPPRDPRKPLPITVKLRGGPECWWEVHARGSMARYPGHLSIHDVFSEINRGAGA